MTHVAPIDPILVGIAELFVGGELEVIGLDYAYRGKIAALAFVPANTKHGAEARVTLEWNAKADGQRMGGGYVPTNGWDEDTELEYTCNTDLPNREIGQPHQPNITFEMMPEGLRAHIFNPYTSEVTVFYAKGGSQLDTTKVRWLPDGPKAKAESRMNRTEPSDTTTACGLDR